MKETVLRLRHTLSLTCVLAFFASVPAVTSAEEDGGDEVTFSEHVAAIVYQNCTSCHRPGEAGPFPLTSYDEVRKRGRMIKKVTAEGYMPPWHPVKGHGDFHGERRLSEEEIQTLAKWVDSGMEEGDATPNPELDEAENEKAKKATESAK